MFSRYKLFMILAYCGLVTAGISSCTKKLNTNQDDPNGLSIAQVSGKDVFPQALLSTVTNKIGANINNATDNYDYAQQWMGFWARNNGWASSGSQQQMETFSLNNSFGDGIWASLYHNIYDYGFIITHSTANSLLPGAARVMRSMIFQDLVDQFGNIPYSQAILPPTVLKPAYDSAAAIYKDLILQLDTAITSITASQSTADDASDIMFKGNKTLWLEFANTIKLRILLRQVPYGDQNYVATEIGNIVQQGSGFLNAGQDATINPGFTDATQKQNPFWAVYGSAPDSTAFYQNNNFFIANLLMINFLDSISDPRLSYFYALNSKKGYGGEFFGETPNAASLTSPIGHGILQNAAMPALLFSASQSLFMQAEAAQRGLLKGSYATFYKQGVEESYRYLTVPNPIATADSVLGASTNGMVNINVSTNPLQTIMYQKWIAECELDGLEAWSDWRRTGYPYIATPSYASNGNIPVRILYPETEYTQNLSNVQAQGQAPGDIYKPLFWFN